MADTPFPERKKPRILLQCIDCIQSILLEIPPVKVEDLGKDRFRVTFQPKWLEGWKLDYTGKEHAEKETQQMLAICPTCQR